MTPWRKVFVFVSSTFNDMHAERDFLVKRVFPELAEWCERRKLRLVDVDLRWGVAEADAAGNRDAVRVCLTRVDECRPFFLCFLGQRYGWVPRRTDLSAATLVQFPGVEPLAGTASVTELEIHHAVVASLGDPERGEPVGTSALFYLREDDYLAELPADPPLLRETFGDGREPALVRLRQDILGRAGYPVRRYRARWRSGGSANTPELALPTVAPASAPEAISRWRELWYRHAGIEVSGDSIPADTPAALAAVAFNRRLTDGRLGDFSCVDPDAAGRQLGEALLDDLQTAILERYPERAETVPEDELHSELDRQAEFRFDRCQAWVARSGDFEELDDFVRRPEAGVLVILADGGMGKSALLANWVERGLPRPGPETGATLHVRFIGASDRSASADGLLRSLLLELRAQGAFPDSLPPNDDAVRAAWPRLLAAASELTPRVFVLDGLDQLEGGVSDLGWLPSPPPPGVHFIVSLRSTSPGATELVARWRQSPHFQVSTVRPLDESGDRRQLVDGYLAQYLKNLDAGQIADLIARPGAGNPLFLKAAAFELRVFGSFDQLGRKLRSGVGEDPVSVFNAMLERLEGDPPSDGLESNRIVPILFGALALARGGLARGDLAELIREFPGWESAIPPTFQAVRDNVQRWLRELRPFLSRRDGRDDLLYESFRLAAQQRYVGPPSNEFPARRPVEAWHLALAGAFLRRARVGQHAGQPLFDVRIDHDLFGQMGAAWMRALDRQLESSAGSDPSSGASVEQDVLDEVHRVGRAMLEVAGIPHLEQIKRLDELRDRRWTIVGRAPLQAAEALATALRARDISATVIPATGEPGSWRSASRHDYMELLYHAVEAGMWEEVASRFADEAFRSRAMPLVGPLNYLGFFQRFVATAKSDAGARTQLRRLQAELPVNDFTEPLLDLLTEALQDQPEELAELLIAFANDPARHAPARIALRALRHPALGFLNLRSPSTQTRIELASKALAVSPDKRVRWETVSVWHALNPRGDSQALAEIASEEREHPLVRAEAVRRLGEHGDATVLPLLRRLAGVPLYPLGRLAARAARSLEQSLRLAPPEPIEHFPQQTTLPADLDQTLQRLGFVLDGERPVLRPPRRLLLLHVVLPDSLSTDSQWKVAGMLEGVLRELPCRTVCSESGAGDMNLSHIRQAGALRVAQEVASRRFHDLEIGPDEYLQLATEYDFRLLGVDNREILLKAIQEKQRGAQGLQYVASVTRARTMIDGALAALRASPCPVAVLITHSLPAVQIAALIGERSQSARRLGYGSDTRMLESMLPEQVPKGVSVSRDDVAYLVWPVTDTGIDRFEMDVNFVHSAVSVSRAQARGNLSGSLPPVWKVDLAAAAGQDCSALTLRQTRLPGAGLAGARLRRADLTAAELAGADLSRADLRGTTLRDADCAGANLGGANLFGAQAQRCRLSRADLRGASLHSAVLQGADLRNADLTGALLIEADLRDALLDGADLTGADCRRARLEGASLIGAGTVAVRWDAAVYDHRTAWGEGFDPEALPLLPVRILPLALRAAAIPGADLAEQSLRARLRGQTTAGEALEAAAIAAWESALPDAAGRAEAMNALARAQQTLGFHEAALPLCWRAIMAWGDTPGTDGKTGWNNLGLSLVELGRFELAEVALRRALELSPEFAPPLYWLARLCQKRGQPEDGVLELSWWRRYLKAGPTTVERQEEANRRVAELASLDRPA